MSYWNRIRFSKVINLPTWQLVFEVWPWAAILVFKRILLRIRFSTWSLLLLVLLLLMSHVVGYLYMVYSGPTAATHDWLLWTANHIQGPQQPHMIFFSPKIQNFEKIFFCQKIFLNFILLEKTHYLRQKTRYFPFFPAFSFFKIFFNKIKFKKKRPLWRCTCFS